LLHPRHFRGRHHAATILVVLVLAVAGFRLFPVHDVTVVHDGQSARVSSMFSPETDALSAAAVALRPGDKVLEGTGGGKQSFAVQRARPVRVEADGALLEVNTLATTVGGALADMGVELKQGDRVFIGGRLTTTRGPLVSADFVSRAAPVSEPASAAVPVTVQVRRARPVTVLVDTREEKTASAADTVHDLLLELGMTVLEVDLVQPGLNDPVPLDTPVRLKKATSIAVRLDSKDQTLYTLARTVADVVQVMGVELGPEDIVEPALDTPVTAGMAVRIARTRVAEEVEEQPIPPRTVEEEDSTAPRDSVVLVPGTPGLLAITHRVTYKNGERIESTTIGSAVVRQPVPARRIVGTKGAASVSKPSGGSASGGASSTTRPAGKRTMVVVATWYDASHGGWARSDPYYGTTASGLKLRKGLCAVDESVIPRYTRFWVPDYGECMAADTGGGVHGFHIDVGFEEGDGAWWGRRDVEITILD
jgi:uncharacterized protein YabE (DUF348 family)